MATTTTTTTTTTTKRKATTAPAYDPTQLPTTAQQYRHNNGGTGTPGAAAYVQALRTLAAWAGTGPAKPYVHALVHLGWCAGSGARVVCKASNSAAYRHAAPVLAVGAPAAPQVCAMLAHLQDAGAPAAALAAVWATYTAA